MDANIRLDEKHSLEEIISNALNQNPEFSKSKLSASLGEKELVLSGTVSNYYQKQLAQETIRSLADELEIRNDIKVKVR